MLAALVRSDLRLLNLGARDHAALLGHDVDLCSRVFADADGCCHVCGTHVPEALEIDHTRGHARGKSHDAGLRAICQFCHNLKHPLWAAARGRIVPVWAPDIPQIDLTRLSWSMVAWREVHPQEFELVRRDLLVRAGRFADTFACQGVEALFEAAFATCDALGASRAGPLLAQVDQVLRFVPAEVLLDGEMIADETIDQSMRLSTLSVGGFRKIPRSVARSMLMTHDPEVLGGPGAGGDQTSVGAS